MIPKRFFWLIDLAATLSAFLVSYALWPQYSDFVRSTKWLDSLRPSYAHDLPQLGAIVWVFALAGPMTVFFISLFEGHNALLRQSLTRIVLSSFGAPMMAAGAVALMAFAIQRTDVSRLFIFAFTVLSGLALCTFRLAAREYLTRRRNAGFYAKRVLLIGNPETLLSLIRHFRENVSSNEYRIVGCLADTECDGETSRQLEETQIRSFLPATDVGDLLIHYPIDEVFAVQAASGSPWVRKVIEDCDQLGVLLRIVPENLLFGKTRTLRALYPQQLMNLPAVVLAPPHFDSDALFFKRMVDIMLSMILLLLLSPLFLLIAILIKVTDPKSQIFYRWNVVGRNGVRFTGYKFTTMSADADERRNELLVKNEMTGPVFKIKNDPRVTSVGRFLRKYSLNELPQLWSVLKGDMSLVGPRPAFPHELEGYGFWHKRKLSIRPGITCLWQVRGRNRISNFDDWVKLDLEYIDNWSLWLDFKILFRTAWAVVAGTGS